MGCNQVKLRRRCFLQGGSGIKTDISKKNFGCVNVNANFLDVEEVEEGGVFSNSQTFTLLEASHTVLPVTLSTREATSAVASLKVEEKSLGTTSQSALTVSEVAVDFMEFLKPTSHAEFEAQPQLVKTLVAEKVEDIAETSVNDACGISAIQFKSVSSADENTVFISVSATSVSNTALPIQNSCSKVIAAENHSFVLTQGKMSAFSSLTVSPMSSVFAFP